MSRRVRVTVCALAALLALRTIRPSAADPWPDNGVKVMATNGAVYTLPGPSGQIRVIAKSALCTPAGSAGYAAGLMDTSGHVFAGNGTENLLFCYPADGSSLNLD